MITVNQIEFNARVIEPEYLSRITNIYIRPEDVRVMTNDYEYVDLVLKDGMVIQFCFEDEGCSDKLVSLFFYNDEFKKPEFTL
jgi:hypothetical protein